MPKTIFTPIDELICGKIDSLVELLQKMAVIKSVKEPVVQCIHYLEAIRYDAERMEKKLIEYKTYSQGGKNCKQ